jgi:hypothetical protein
MMKNRRNWIFGIIGTIMLGAIGSGLWSLLLEPSLSWVARGTLTLATLGISSVRDNVYQDIAKGYTEAPGLFLIALITGFIFFVVLGYSSFRLGQFVGDRIFSKFIKRHLSTETDKIVEKLELELKKYENHLRKLEIVLIVLTILIASFLYVQYSMLKYTNSAITHFQQCFTICRPYLDEAQEKKVLAQFSQIKNKQDYIDLMNQLYEIGHKKGADFPKFTIW